MYEDLTMELIEDLNADGEFWDSVKTPWEDYDDYFPEEELNNESEQPSYEEL
jgi:hypothetical protein